MKVKEFYLNSEEEIIVKIVREILMLFRIEVVDSNETDYDLLMVENTLRTDGRPFVLTKLSVMKADGEELSFSCSDEAGADEREGAAIHRLIKLNLYRLFCEHFSMEPVPWGIFNGVRPTKIVHRYIRQGMEEEEIRLRLMRDYAVSQGKAACITQMAFRQRPFLASSDEKTISIYVGIPFCLSRCLYCSFPAYVLPGREKLDEFMSAWQKDLTSVCQAIETYGLKVQNIYVGGGTPTSLPDTYFSDMLHRVHEAFYGASTVEFTVEAGRPDSMSPAKIACMVELGVNRVSVNPQTMQQRTLERIGRSHTPEDIVQMFYDLREAGIPQINMDLILGLPGETVEDVEDSMQKVSALQPDDITLHALALKRGSRLKLHLDEIELPGDEVTQRMFSMAMSYIGKLGMRPYYLYRQGYMSGQLENVGCCRPGAEGMYNIQIMEEHQTILGIGGAAASKIVDFNEHRLKTSFNAKDLLTYLSSVDKYIERRASLLREVYGV